MNHLNDTASWCDEPSSERDYERLKNRAINEATN